MYKKSLLLFLLIIVALSYGDFAHSQNRANSPAVRIVHTPPKIQQLPNPGGPLQISATLLNTRNSQLVVKGFFVRDGKLLELELDDFSMDPNGQLVYSTTIHAPLVELKYQFAVLDGKDAVANSGRYSLSRSCIPDITSIDANIPQDSSGSEKLKLLQLQATLIQEEVNNYDAVSKLLEELKMLTSN